MYQERLDIYFREDIILRVCWQMRLGMHSDIMESYILVSERVIVIQTLEKNVDKEGETLAAMVSTCMKLLLLSFQTFPKCNLRAFLTKAETSCGSVATLTRKVQNTY